MSFAYAYDQVGAEEDGSICIRESEDMVYTHEGESKLNDDQPENQPKPGVQHDIFEEKISRFKHRLAPGGNLENYADRLTQKPHGLCITSRLALTCDVGSGTYPYQGPVLVKKMSEVELLIVWLHDIV